ncbi:MAG: polysaccharide chain length determinant protein [Hydrocarboniphaga sp.]|uniref:Wzz/FepE/Etk N-terminal domain-containing protein n=1 Tax=Hydrocarboniphaga sp. TaxID=2033016 RepID=UPI0026327BB1|nr:Wzz/FepE/Etk N-terminal domain-containing protein [Hydrocarboniphaga sp.]MDB5970487.1 polysaccharide chain length determinant protein [Hydrocarboniphaga sp.]
MTERSSTAEPEIREITFGEIRNRLRSRWLLIAFCALLGAAVGSAIALYIKPVYRAEILMLPVARDQSEGGIGSLPGQLGGLASLAGLSLGQESDRKIEAVATLQSRALTEAFISEENLLPILFADRWDASQSKWDVKDPKDIPTLWDGNRVFSRRVRFMTEEKKTGLITVAVEWTNPELAQKWVTELVRRTNELLKKRAIERAEANIQFVQTQLQSATVIEVRQTLFHLIEGQIKVIMLAQSSADYAFNVLDPAVVPKERVRPKRSLIASLFLLGGLLLAALYALVNPKIKDSD